MSVRGFTRVRRALPEALRERVIGATWHSAIAIWYDKATRFQQIERYVGRANVQQWLAIDDLHEHSENWNASYESHLVKTNPQLGLSDSVALAHLQSTLLSSEK